MTYPWTDNPTVSGVAQCDTDILNDCLMHLKYNNATRNIGEIVQSTIPLTDAGLHLLDGSLISGSGSYSTFVDYIISLYYNNASIYYKWEATFNSTTYTTYTRVKNPTTDDYYYSTYGTTQIQRFAEYNVGNITWQVDGSGTIYYATSEATLVGTGLIGNVSPTPPSYFETEVNWQQSVTDYGVCGKFVYDNVNNTVRLPKITGFTEGMITPSSVGDLTTAGLPNITGALTGASGIEYGSGSGAITEIIGNVLTHNVNQTGRTNGFTFDASRSSSIYGNSNTVQPQSIKVLYYIVIATSTKTDVQVDIDEIATDLNGKADVDLTNTVPTSSFATSLNTAGIRTVIETYISGASWYRIYSDKWCEQGGIRGSGVGVETQFLKTYTDTNYTLVVEPIGQSGQVKGQEPMLYNKSSSGFYSYYGDAYYSINWYACGYIN